MSNGRPPPVVQRKRTRSSPLAKQHLHIGQLENNWAALGYAERLGLVPNESLDIHFDRGDLLDPVANSRSSLMTFLKLARQWIERRGGQTTYIWVLERRTGAEGVHAHVIIHVPPQLVTRFHQLKPGWARLAGLDMAIGGVIHRTQMASVEQAKGKLRYMSKDLDPKHWSMFDLLPLRNGCCQLDDRGKPSDLPIYGKKTGTSRNIGEKARKQHRG